MSGYTGFKSVSQTLVSLIWNSIKDDTQITGIIDNDNLISTYPPNEAKTKFRISIYLYNITEYSGMRNQPLSNVQTSGNPSSPLLYLTLHYLMTPLTQNPENDQILLGKIMQLFAETPVIRGSALKGSLAGTNSEIKVVLDSFSPDDINKLWSVLGMSHKLSVGYSVSPVTIESVRVMDQKRVVEEKINYGLKEETL